MLGNLCGYINTRLGRAFLTIKMHYAAAETGMKTQRVKTRSIARLDYSCGQAYYWTMEGRRAASFKTKPVNFACRLSLTSRLIN